MNSKALWAKKMYIRRITMLDLLRSLRMAPAWRKIAENEPSDGQRISFPVYEKIGNT